MMLDSTSVFSFSRKASPQHFQNPVANRSAMQCYAFMILPVSHKKSKCLIVQSLAFLACNKLDICACNKPKFYFFCFMPLDDTNAAMLSLNANPRKTNKQIILITIPAVNPCGVYLNVISC